MKPLDFLADVLPSPGHGVYCVAELSETTKKEHLFVEVLGDIKPKVKEWLGKGREIYFALSTFDPTVLQNATPQGRFYKGRKAENARHIKSLFVDLDGYASKKEAVLRLQEFLASTGLDEFGTPHVVGSGGGVHCYWPLTETVDITTWKPVAENFKRLFKQEKMRIDDTVTADAARVLRIPGTFNNKAKYKKHPDDPPRKVELLIEGNARVDIRRFGAVVRSKLSNAYAPLSNDYAATSVSLEGVRPSKATTKKSAAAASLLSNSVTFFAPIWDKTERGEGCGQLDYYMQHATEDGMEPIWRGLLSWSRVCEDASEFNRKLSDLHPYEPQRMQQKLAEIKGPYACAKMDEQNPGICPGCPHWGKFTNALALGREVTTDNRAKTILVPQDLGTGKHVELEEHHIQADVEEELAENDGPEQKKFRTTQRLAAPRGFEYGQNGGVYRRVREKDDSGTVIETMVPVLTHDLYVVDLLRVDEKEQHVHMMSIKPVGMVNDETGEDTRENVFTPLIFPMEAVVSKDALLKSLASHGILSAFGTGSDANLTAYVRAAVSEATSVLKVVDVPKQFGWQKDGSFVYNNRIFRPDGTEITLPMPGLENLNRVTNSKGTLEGWRQFYEMIIQREMYTMLSICMSSFGSTLMQFSDYEGFTWHIGSTESGTGKSLALSAQAAVWGHPIHYRTGKGSSAVAMQHRAGLLNSLPLLVDEITDKVRAEPDWAAAMIFDLSEGKGKERMESGSNKERMNDSTWATHSTMTSNVHLSDVLTGGRKHSSEGELMRMLEWTPTENLKWSKQDRLALAALRQNYGVAGEAWARWIVCNRSTAIRVFNETHLRLKEIMDFTDEERYWHAGCASNVAAAILLGPKYANILTVPVQKVIEALLGLVNNAREVKRTTHRDAEDVLNAYTREYYGKFVVIRKDDAGNIAAAFGKDATTKTSTRNTVMGRVEEGVREGCVEFFIEESLLKQHCAAMSFGYADFKRQMEIKARAAAAEGKLFIVEFKVKKDMLARTDGPAMRVTAMKLTLPKNALPDELKHRDENTISVGAG